MFQFFKREVLLRKNTIQENDYKSSKRSYNSELESIDSSLIFDNLKLWRVEDVAKYLNCSVGHIYNLCSDERIPKIKKGKFNYFIPEKIYNWVLEGN